MTPATAQANPSAQMGPHLRTLTQLHLADHVQMVSNALGAVRSLAMLGDGMNEHMHMLRQNDLGDLIEIINDRLAMALEAEEFRAAR